MGAGLVGLLVLGIIAWSLGAAALSRLNPGKTTNIVSYGGPTNTSANCQDLQDFRINLIPILGITSDFFEYPSFTVGESAPRWAVTWNGVRKMYEALDYPPAYGRYVQLSIETARNYEDGLGLMALGYYDSGKIRVEQGDATHYQATAALRAANAECGR
jgi:hypothetical protein